MLNTNTAQFNIHHPQYPISTRPILLSISLEFHIWILTVYLRYAVENRRCQKQKSFSQLQLSKVFIYQLKVLIQNNRVKLDLSEFIFVILCITWPSGTWNIRFEFSIFVKKAWLILPYTHTFSSYSSKAIVFFCCKKRN